MRLKQLMISKYIAERDKINHHLPASPLFCSRSGSTPRAPGALPGHDGGAIWPAARIRAPGHRPSAFPKDTSEAPFGAKWSTIALGAFPTAFAKEGEHPVPPPERGRESPEGYCGPFRPKRSF